MAYMLENESGAHTATVLESLTSWGKEQPDVFLVSDQGAVIMTHRVFLKLYSRVLDSALQSYSSDSTPSIFIPASTQSLVNLIKVLSTGYSMASNKEELLDVLKTAELIGISMKGVQIGTKKKSKTNPVKDEKDTVDNRVQVKHVIKEDKEALDNQHVKKKRMSVKAKGDNLYVKKESGDLSCHESSEVFDANRLNSEVLESSQDIGGNEGSDEVGCEKRTKQGKMGIETHEQSVNVDEGTANMKENQDLIDENF